MEQIESCVLCGSDKSHFHPEFVKEGYCIVKCGQCGLVFVNPRDDQETIVKQYLDDETSPIEYYRRTSSIDTICFNERLKTIKSVLPKGKLLDIGCNVGTFLEAAKNFGWEPVGIEANEKACQYCREKGFQVFQRLFDRGAVAELKDEKYNLISMNDSLEHFQNPLEALRLVYDLLPAGGLVSVSTPNINSILARLFQVKPKEHLFYFDSETIKKLLRSSGFEIVKLIKTGRRRDVGSMHYGTSLKGPWVIISKFLAVSGLSALVSIMLKSVFKEEIFIIARKRG